MWPPVMSAVTNVPERGDSHRVEEQVRLYLALSAAVQYQAEHLRLCPNLKKTGQTLI